MKKEHRDSLNAMTFLGAMLLLMVSNVLFEILSIILTSLFCWSLWVENYGYDSFNMFVGSIIGFIPAFPIHLIMRAFRKETILVGYRAWLMTNRNNYMYDIVERHYFELKENFQK